MGKGEHSYGPLDLIHFDVCGPLSINVKGGFVYFIIFIDDHFGYLYFVRYKSKSFEKSKEFKYEAKKQLRRSIKSLR